MPRKHHYLAIRCVGTSCVETCKSRKQVLGDVKAVQVQAGLYLVHEDRSADSNEAASVIVVEELVVHVALKSLECIICKLTEGSDITVWPHCLL